MSRTFKTDPIWTKMNHPERVGMIVHEEHNHEKGECDLPEFPERNAHNTRCWWNYDTQGKNVFCGCDLCTGRSYRKIAKKASRRASNERRRNFKSDPEYYEGDQLEDTYMKNMDW